MEYIQINKSIVLCSKRTKINFCGESILKCTYIGLDIELYTLSYAYSCLRLVTYLSNGVFYVINNKYLLLHAIKFGQLEIPKSLSRNHFCNIVLIKGPKILISRFGPC